MSRKKRNLKHQKVSPTSGAAPSSQPVEQVQPSPAMPPTSTVRVNEASSFLNKNKETFLSISAIIIAIFALVYAKQQAEVGKQQADVAQQTLDIATGKRQAKIEQADFFPKYGDHKEEDIGNFGGKEVFKQPFYRNANSMVVMAPAIYFNNVGVEPIDAVRVEVSFVGGIVDRMFEMFDLLNSPKEWYKNETPVIIRAVHREETILPRPWQPNEALRLVILKGVLDQITQVQSKTHADKMHLAELSILVSARIAGSNIFSGTTPEPMLYKVAWKPSGFPDDEVKRLKESYVGVQLFGEMRKPIIPIQYMLNPHRGSFNDRPSFSQPSGNK